MKLAIVGSRDFSNLQWVREYVASLPPDTVVVSGGARGVDQVAVSTWQALRRPTKTLPADWARLGRGAGYARNAELVSLCDYVVAFWDGQSRGTAHTIDLARRSGKLAWVVFNTGRVESALTLELTR